MPADNKLWSVLGYFAGDNNLSGAAIDDINEMETVGSTADVDMLVQVDHAADYNTGDDRWRSTRRYHITRDNNPKKIGSKLLGDLGETNSGDPKILTDFLGYSIAEHPAEHTIIILWNHGSGFYVPEGWINTEEPPDKRELNMRAGPAMKRTFFSSSKREILVKPPGQRGICYDDRSHDCLDNKELKEVMRYAQDRLGGRKVDILGMDACLMTMVEVAYQVKGQVKILVGSEETEPSAGWPYDTILADLTARPDMTGAELARSIVTRYIDSYGGPSSQKNVTQSALDLSKLGDLTSAMDDLAKALLAKSGINAFEDSVWSARRKSTSFYDSLYVDIHHLARNIAARVEDAPTRAACEGVMRAIDGNGAVTPILAEAHSGDRMAQVKGLSVYWPLSVKPSSYYGELDFAKTTRWHDLLSAYVGQGV